MFRQKWAMVLSVVLFLGLIQVAVFSQQVNEQPRLIKPIITKPPAVISTVGEKKNYNLQNYLQYGIGTIEWIKNENRYRARVGFTGPEGFVYFNSYHQSFEDAQHTINFVKEGKTSGKLYNIFGETLEVHITPTPGPHGETTVVEVLGLIYSYTI
jgi:hypothetical protein